MIGKVKFDEKGLMPAIIQDINSGQVLMMAYMNEESLNKTIETNKTWFYSRSRQELWMKGESSGHIQDVKKIMYDCDADTLLIQVEQTGVACHTGHYSCFYNDIEGNEIEETVFDADNIYSKESAAILYELQEIIQQRKEEMPEGSYTTYLFEKGIDKILKKVGEENAEVIIAAKNKGKNELIYETSDLIYHLLVLLAEKDIELSQILTELRKRR
ncbi:Phosphoribosyl-AMP cyclohydrolase [Candidatus Syntrophocurvum alkaliphilum]|uniref:Histidine biosynthesis bifunctional protein HisIE n=1 Tax=Candidatus Syntrophocurvum alkaliphilum TaxID=2293317 RepID=A0A6I6DE72_9FIRM|nr:bifunctional phosphoribosyl-AMP cyclohydrolase/phosphoribosyl-ATP diphosphatase HisIE [Candidatus Syntrophocurvum alkaliphilum]QGT98821.1 Phosphoribosyl-AMP cyclohydrolase [Candidatus Syntrophocurvum alkaliphilum]